MVQRRAAASLLIAALAALLSCGKGAEPGSGAGGATGNAPAAATSAGGAGGSTSASTGGGATSSGATTGAGTSTGGAATSTSGSSGANAPGWYVIAQEDFESGPISLPAWKPDPVPDDGPFADHGAYFANQGITPPNAFRLSAPFGEQGWLSVESYTRDQATAPSQLASVVQDPANPQNHALKIASPHHTDATVVRPTDPLPPRYRISVRVGFPDFGDGKAGLNGYQGGESAEPWLTDSSIGQNGFYWLAILDAPPRPHNNVYIHHHRKVVMDSDNNYPPWMEEWNGSQFVQSGEHPLMMFALDGKAQGTELTGKPFRPWAAGDWQPSGTVRAVDQYLPGEWYSASITRDGTTFTLQVSGRFAFGGDTTYTATIDAQANCIWHFNRSADEDASGCIDDSYFPSVGPQFPNWPAGATWPDFFMFGDPHENFYEGSVLYDDVKLEGWRG